MWCKFSACVTPFVVFFEGKMCCVWLWLQIFRFCWFFQWKLGHSFDGILFVKVFNVRSVSFVELFSCTRILCGRIIQISFLLDRGLFKNYAMLEEGRGLKNLITIYRFALEKPINLLIKLEGGFCDEMLFCLQKPFKFRDKRQWWVRKLKNMRYVTFAIWNWVNFWSLRTSIFPKIIMDEFLNQKKHIARELKVISFKIFNIFAQFNKFLKKI